MTTANRPDPHHEAIARDLVFGRAAGHPFPDDIPEPAGVWRALYLAFAILFTDAQEDGWGEQELAEAVLTSAHAPDQRWHALVEGVIHRLTRPDADLTDLFSRNMPAIPCRETIAVITEIVVAFADATLQSDGPIDLAAECSDAISRGTALPAP